MKRYTTESKLVCSVCWSPMYIPRVVSSQRETGHIKDMWCYVCKAERKFIECNKHGLLPWEVSHMSGPKSAWIETYSGGKFHPLDPQHEEVKIEDIAHALANTCRFNGHVRYFFSVAQHSYNCAQVLRKHSAKLGFAGLLHDASEAYLADVPAPIKPYLMNYTEIENRVNDVIRHVYGIILTHEEWELLHSVDKQMLTWEAHHLMHNNDWNPESERSFFAHPCTIGYRTPGEAEDMFMSLFLELNTKRKQYVGG